MNMMPRKPPFQFGLGGLFAVMFWAAVLASSGHHNPILEATAPFAAALGITIGFGGVLWLAAKRLKNL
jgi:hypothetical protein